MRSEDSTSHSYTTPESITRFLPTWRRPFHLLEFNGAVGTHPLVQAPRPTLHNLLAPGSHVLLVQSSKHTVDGPYSRHGGILNQSLCSRHWLQPAVIHPMVVCVCSARSRATGSDWPDNVHSVKTGFGCRSAAVDCWQGTPLTHNLRPARAAGGKKGTAKGLLSGYGLVMVWCKEKSCI